MADVLGPVSDKDVARDRWHALRLLQAFCLLAAIGCAGLLGLALIAMVAIEPSTTRTMRAAMLHPGLTVLALMLGGAALTAARLGRLVDDRNLARLRERLYFVATVAALVLAPSALLGWRWAFAQRPIAGIGVALAMEAIALLIVLLLLVRNARDALRLRVQPDRPVRRSMSSIL